jgi:hypothetical protein
MSDLQTEFKSLVTRAIGECGVEPDTLRRWIAEARAEYHGERMCGHCGKSSPPEDWATCMAMAVEPHGERVEQEWDECPECGARAEKED